MREGRKKLWRDLADQYQKQGKPRHVAEALATKDVKLALKKEAGDAKHVMLAQIAAARRSQALVDGSQRLTTLMTDRLEHTASSPTRGRPSSRRNRLSCGHSTSGLKGPIREHSRSLLGNVRNPPGLRNVVRELHGESSGDVVAYAVADAVRTAFEDMRLMFNGAGGTIGKLENWGLPHTHNRTAMRRAGVVAPQADEVRSRLAWDKIEDDLTGRPLAEAGSVPPTNVQGDFLAAVYDNVIYGRVDGDSTGVPGEGQALWRPPCPPPVFCPFRSADDWIAYDAKFRTGDPFGSIIGHAHRMARDIALAREYGPDPRTGFRQRKAYAVQRHRTEGNPDLAGRIEGSATHGERMLAILNGSLIPVRPFARSLRQLRREHIPPCAHGCIS